MLNISKQWNVIQNIDVYTPDTKPVASSNTVRLAELSKDTVIYFSVCAKKTQSVSCMSVFYLYMLYKFL